MITVTESAFSQMENILEKKGDAIVRYELKAGGCGGIMSEWKTESHHEPEKGEHIWVLSNGKLVIDEFTADFIDGGTINYKGDFMPSFKIELPNRMSCGCGESFQA